MKSRNPVQRLALVFTIALVAAGPARASSIVTIPPSGDDTGQIDYENLQSALLEAMPGTTIQLEIGTYHLNYPVVAENFRGRLKGAGQGLTIITTAGELPAFINGDDPPQLYPPSVDNPWPLLLSFVDSRFTLSDMTFQITDLVPCRFDFYDQQFEVLQSIVGVIGGGAGNQVRSSIKRVSFEGAEGAYGGYNCIHSVLYAGNAGPGTSVLPVTGKYVLSGSSMESTYTGVSAFNLAENAALTIRNNTIADVAYGHLMMGSSGWIAFLQNEVSAHPSLWGGDGYGAAVIQGFLTVPMDFALPPMMFTLSGNVFHVEAGLAGVYAGDWQFAYLGTPPSLFMIARNNTIVSDSAVYGIHGYGLTNAVMVNNEVQGTVLDAGLMMELTAEGWFLLNDVREVTAGTAPFVLAADTHDNLVIAVNAWEDVLDLTDDPSTPEYDGANTIISIGSWCHDGD